MYLFKKRRILALSAAVFALTVLLSGVGQSQPLIDPGYDLFRTDPSSWFNFTTVPNPQVVNFDGAPLGSFNFGNGNGLVNVGNTDTIVQRTQQADIGGGSDTINIEMVALSLHSVSVVDLGMGAGFEYIDITLNTSSPTTQSTMTIFGSGTFDSILNFSFDVTGSVGGYYTTMETTLTSAGNPWQHDPTGAPVIDGINHLLNGTGTGNDFWATATGTGPSGDGNFVSESHPGVGVHKAYVDPVPEPGTSLLLGLGLVGLALSHRRRTC